MFRKVIASAALGVGLMFGAAAWAQQVQPAARPNAPTGTPRIVLGMSGWTGFSPLSLAERAGLFHRHGIDVEIKFVPQANRHLAMAAGEIQALATTVDTQIVYAASGVAVTQVMIIDRSNGGDGIAVRPAIRSFADLRGRTVAVDRAGTTPYFMLAYMLKRNNLTVRDVNLIPLAPQPAAQAFVAGQNDAVVTYEPYLSTVRQMGDQMRILATTTDYPVVVDTLAFPPEYIQRNPQHVRAVIAGFFDALEMIRREPARSNEIMGSVVRQTGEQFAASARYIHWLNRDENLAYFQNEMRQFLEYAAQIQLETGVIRAIPDLNQLVNPGFLRPQS
jgi:NitT/TauT family transport system substrate-binding protein